MSKTDPDLNRLERLRVYLSLKGEDLNPDVITATLGIAPSRAWHKGEQRKPSRPPYTFGMWTLDTPIPLTEPFETQLTALLDLLITLPAELKTYTRRFVSYIAITCYFGQYQVGFHVDRPSMDHLAVKRQLKFPFNDN